jgi:hypothetical protein
MDPAANSETSIPLDQKPVCLDVHGDKVMVAALGPMLYTLDLSKTVKPTRMNPIKTGLTDQIRCLAIAPRVEGDAWAVGSIFGLVEATCGHNTYSIFCHREENTGSIWASTAMAALPDGRGVLSAGSNGGLVYIDLETGKRGKEVKLTRDGFPFSCIAVSPRSDVCAIGQGYDWCCGFRNKEERPPVEIWIKKIVMQELF